MASLGLGWIGDRLSCGRWTPYFAVGVTPETAIHSAAFKIAFTLITGLHLVIGEQAPKIFSIRRAEPTLLRCALPLQWFYRVSYPLMVALNMTTALLLRWVGLTRGSALEPPHRSRNSGPWFTKPICGEPDPLRTPADQRGL